MNKNNHSTKFSINLLNTICAFTIGLEIGVACRQITTNSEKDIKAFIKKIRRNRVHSVSVRETIVPHSGCQI